MNISPHTHTHADGPSRLSGWDMMSYDGHGAKFHCKTRFKCWELIKKPLIWGWFLSHHGDDTMGLWRWVCDPIAPPSPHIFFGNIGKHRSRMATVMPSRWWCAWQSLATWLLRITLIFDVSPRFWRNAHVKNPVKNLWKRILSYYIFHEVLGSMGTIWICIEMPFKETAQAWQESVSPSPNCQEKWYDTGKSKWDQKPARHTVSDPWSVPVPFPLAHDCLGLIVVDTFYNWKLIRKTPQEEFGLLSTWVMACFKVKNTPRPIVFLGYGWQNCHCH